MTTCRRKSAELRMKTKKRSRAVRYGANRKLNGVTKSRKTSSIPLSLISVAKNPAFYELHSKFLA